MRRSKFVRVELLLLAAVTLLLAYRVIEGPPAPEGLVVHADLEIDQLRRSAFVVDRPTRITIDAVGSFEASQDERNARLAAYPWIIRRGDRQIAWRMDPSTATRDRETLATAADTVLLEPGTYDVFFTTYGNQRGRHFGISLLDRLFREDASWQGDADRWQILVRASDEGDYVRRLGEDSREAISPQGPGLVWSTAPMKGHEAGEYVFRIESPVDLRVYAVGEIGDEQMDFGWIDDAVSGERIWEMTLSNTEPAGGWDANRVFDGTVSLREGIYTAAFKTDPRQNWDDWVGNPPYDPGAWGMSLYSPEGAAISTFDPWSTRSPLVQIDRVRDSERHTVQFRVTKPIDVAVYGLGEMGGNGRYDYGWLRNNETQQTVWEMTPERSMPAGGHNNRRELAFLTLQPSTYSLTYETDDSHSYSSWRHGEPEHPERWGVTVFGVGEPDTSAVEILDMHREGLGEERERGREARVPEPPTPGRHAHPLPPLPGRHIVDLTSLGNEQRVSRAFTLEREQPLHIRALGEISISAPYDYGWIENAETGQIVWEMNWQNTMPGGGDDSNRLFDGVVTLPAGEYVAHFKTDFSRAYGDFSRDESPNSPEAWGIRIARPEQPPQ